MNEPKEVDVFNRFSKFSKLKVIGISLLIALVSITILYFITKSLMQYTVTYNLNGGYVYGSELKPSTYKFLQKVREPKNVKKRGYYIDYWATNESLTNKFEFGHAIWKSKNLFVKWEEGVAVRLNFADGEENEDMSTEDLRGYYEQYVKSGSNWSLPKVFNDKTESKRYGEQLLWFDNKECTGEPFDEKTYMNITKDIDIYGKWFDTKQEKFKVDENGTLQKYLGYCNRIVLPDNILKIKDIERSKFITGSSDSLHDQEGTNLSVWQNVLDKLEIVYINPKLQKIGDCAFKDCTKLKYIIFKADNVTELGKYSFEECISLCSFDMPTKVKIIPEFCFNGAFVKNVTLKLNNVVTINNHAFINSKIKNVELKNIEKINSAAFSSCNYLEKFIILGDNVVTSDDFKGEPQNNNSNSIFYASNKTFKIYVNESVINRYLAIPYWGMYADLFCKIENI